VGPLAKDDLIILHVLSSAGIAGGERYLQDLVKYTHPSIKHLIILPYYGPFVQVLEDKKYHYNIFNMEKRFSIKSIFSLTQHLKNNAVDIVHTHGYRANFYGRIACMLGGVKNVSTVHVSLYDYTDTPLLIRYLYILIEKMLSYTTSTFICISNAMKEDMLRLGIDPQKIIVIQNGVDLERFYPRPAQENLIKELKIGTNAPVIGTVGRMVTEKGQMYLVEALKYLKNERKDLKCLFVGEGPLLSQLKQMTIDLGVDDISVFTGIRKDIENIYPLLDLFVLPSIREPFGLALLEAMASGLPVLATAAGGPSEFIESEVNGFLVPPRDSKALASKINWILSNKEKVKGIGKEGLKTVKNCFGAKKTAKKVGNIYYSTSIGKIKR
jgi:glycosyltransferase involved in cell wall biosynthesis